MQCDLFIKLAETIEDKEVAQGIITAYKNLRKDFTMIDNLKPRLGVNDKQERDSFHDNLKAALGNL